MSNGQLGGLKKKYAHQQESIEWGKECEYSPVECAKNVRFPICNRTNPV